MFRTSPAGSRPGGRPAYRSADATHPAIWARELKPSLFRMLRTWESTVRSEMNRRAPICLLLSPSATKRPTSTSRFARGPAPKPSAGWVERRADCASSSASALSNQWRTDLVLELDGKSFYIGRLEGGMTRREVKDLGRSWVLKHKGRGLKTRPAATRDTAMPSPGATRA